MNQNPYYIHAEDELTDSVAYERLAKRERNPGNRALLEKLSQEERSHYEFWKSLAGDIEVKPNRARIARLMFLRNILGVTFAVKFLELHEEQTIKEHENLSKALTGASKDRLLKMINEEVGHEKTLISQLKERRISYIGFIALGLADAIVEITGVHAGFLGVTGSTLIAGISGVIVGFAAAISMGSASYLQAKQDPEKSPFVSAFATWVSYFCSVILLALPYFLIRTMVTAFTLSTLVGVILLAIFTFYSAVVFDRKFLGEFGESVFLMLGTALATYILGALVGHAFHVTGASF